MTWPPTRAAIRIVPVGQCRRRSRASVRLLPATRDAALRQSRQSRDASIARLSICTKPPEASGQSTR
jgi:hypothetical protein